MGSEDLLENSIAPRGVVPTPESIWFSHAFLGRKMRQSGPCNTAVWRMRDSRSGFDRSPRNLLGIGSAGQRFGRIGAVILFRDG